MRRPTGPAGGKLFREHRTGCSRTAICAVPPPRGIESKLPQTISFGSDCMYSTTWAMASSGEFGCFHCGVAPNGPPSACILTIPPGAGRVPPRASRHAPSEFAPLYPSEAIPLESSSIWRSAVVACSRIDAGTATTSLSTSLSSASMSSRVRIPQGYERALTSS